MSNETSQMRIIAENLWSFIQPKIEQLLANSVSFFRAEVVKAPSGGKVAVKKAFDSAEIELPCAESAANLETGDQCLVLVFGNMSNAWVVGKAQLWQS